MASAFSFLGASEPKYAFLYGRVMGAHSRMLGRQDFDTLAAAVSLDEAVAVLEASDYEPELSRINVAEVAYPELERALEAHYLRVYGEFVPLLPGEDAVEFDALFRGLWLHENLVALLRATAAELSAEEKSGLLNPYSDFDFAPLASAQSMAEFGRALPEPYASALAEAVDAFEEEQRIEPLESLMAKTLAASLLEKVSNPNLTLLVRALIDEANLKVLARRSLGEVAGLGEHLIKADGLHLTVKHLSELSGLESFEATAAYLADTPYGDLLKGAGEAAEAGAGLSGFERKLKNFVWDELTIEATKNPLSMLPLLVFLHDKRAEARLVRAVLVAKARAMPAEKISELVKAYGS